MTSEGDRIDLARRALRSDGVSVVDPGDLVELLLLGVEPSKIRVTYQSDDVRRFNEQVDGERLEIDNDPPAPLDFTWNLPEKYLTSDLLDILAERFTPLWQELDYSPEEEAQGLQRLVEELEQVQKFGMEHLIRTVIYVIDRFREEGVIWGVGRGSSCASYLLFVIGLHSVDCLRYQVPASEFFHE